MPNGRDRAAERTELAGLMPAELEAALEAAGEKRFRARQIFSWIYKYGVHDFAEMTDLSKNLRVALAERFVISVPAIAGRASSADGLTSKYAFGLADGNIVEAVRIADADGSGRYTVCISTQVGCPIDCAFCHTGKMGFVRNLTAGEIVGQVLGIAFRDGKNDAEGLSNIVYMGMGEPLLNYDNVVRSARLINNPAGLDVSMRKITISTAGVVPGMLRLIGEDIPVTLALSLHAPDDRTRNGLVPLNKKYDIEKVMDAARRYARETSRRVTIEYVMIDGVNDAPEQAEKLAGLLAGGLFHVNIIGLNGGTDRCRPSTAAKMERFAAALDARRINVTIRRSRGADISAACGMLYKKLKKDREDI